MKIFALATVLALPLAAAPAFAAGSGDEAAPEKPKCETGVLMWSKRIRSFQGCVQAACRNQRLRTEDC